MIQSVSKSFLKLKLMVVVLPLHEQRWKSMYLLLKYHTWLHLWKKRLRVQFMLNKWATLENMEVIMKNNILYYVTNWTLYWTSWCFVKKKDCCKSRKRWCYLLYNYIFFLIPYLGNEISELFWLSALYWLDYIRDQNSYRG